MTELKIALVLYLSWVGIATYSAHLIVLSYKEAQR